MRMMTNASLGGLIIASCLLLMPTSAVAQTISVEIRSIAADQQGESLDEGLSDLEPKLTRVFQDYTSFELIERREMDIAEGDSSSLTLPEGSTLTLEFRGWSEGMIKLGLEIGEKLSTTLRASPGSTFFQAGLDYREGILVIAITVDGDPP